jgi:flagellar protein FlgJ
MGIDALSTANYTNVSSAVESVSDSKEADAFKIALEQAQAEENPEEIKKVCQQFEAIFINMLFKQMRNTITEGGLTEKSQARETFEGMLDEEMSKAIAEGGGFGIAEMMTKALSKSIYTDSAETSNQESQHAPIDDQIFNLLEEA